MMFCCVRRVCCFLTELVAIQSLLQQRETAKGKLPLLSMISWKQTWLLSRKKRRRRERVLGKVGLKAKGLQGNRTEEKAVVKTTQLTPPTANQSGQLSQADNRLTSSQLVSQCSMSSLPGLSWHTEETTDSTQTKKRYTWCGNRVRADWRIRWGCTFGHSDSFSY